MSFNPAVARAESARKSLQADTPPAQRVLGTAMAVAGQTRLARFRPGELAARTLLSEDQIHSAIVELVETYEIEACSSPLVIHLTEPDYVEPPEHLTWPAGLRGARRAHTGDEVDVDD